MENKKIIMVRHSPLHVTYQNAFYQNQLGDDVNHDEVIFIDATSRNRDFDFVKQLSPFFIGPVVSSDGKTCKIFENFWQFGKVFKGKTNFRRYVARRKYEDYEFNCSDEDGNPSEEWFKLREYGYNTTNPYRRPMFGQPLYQYYVKDGKVLRLDYIQARKLVYIPEYAKLVVNSDSFKKLKAMVDEGKTIAILDFDAYNYYNEEYMRKRYQNDLKKYGTLKYSLDDYLSIKTMKDAINFPGLLAGHGFVLKLLLQGDIEVIDGKIIDHTGVLDL